MDSKRQQLVSHFREKAITEIQQINFRNLEQGGNRPEDMIVSAIMVILYIIAVCIFLLIATVIVIYCIRKRRREQLSRALMQARARQVPGLPQQNQGIRYNQLDDSNNPEAFGIPTNASNYSIHHQNNQSHGFPVQGVQGQFGQPISFMPDINGDDESERKQAKNPQEF